MPKIDVRVLERLDAMIEKAATVLATHTPLPPGFIGFGTLNTDAYAEWRAQCIVLLQSLLSESHPYVVGFANGTENAGHSGSVKAGLGVLRACREDVANGYLLSVQELVTAEVFSDFLEIANELLAKGYDHAAVSVAGAVLEDGLRRIALKHGVSVKASNGLGSLVGALKQSGKLNALTAKELAVQIEIRNAADHGKWDDVTHENATSMVAYVSSFLERELL